MSALPRLYAKGYSKTDGETPIYFWGLGNYMYEIEARKSQFDVESDVFKSCFEDAMEKFEKKVDKVIVL